MTEHLETEQREDEIDQSSVQGTEHAFERNSTDKLEPIQSVEPVETDDQQSVEARETQSEAQTEAQSDSENASVPVDNEAPQQNDAEESDDGFALVNGERMTELPKDLYIPPDALQVVLESFEGPLDLLLYLIRRQNLDILNIPVAAITRQYMEYVDLMKGFRLELAAEYLLMAALLGEIKSRSLLPRPKDDEGEEEDPRVALIKRLQEYERFKQVAEQLETLPRLGRDFFLGKAAPPDLQTQKIYVDIDIRELLVAFKEVMQRANMFESHRVEKEMLSTRERMSAVLDQLGDQFVPFVSLFTVEEGKLGVVVTFLAILELAKGSMIEFVQSEAFAPIHVRTRQPTEDDEHESRDEGLEDDSSWEREERFSADEVQGLSE